MSAEFINNEIIKAKDTTTWDKVYWHPPDCYIRIPDDLVTPDGFGSIPFLMIGGIINGKFFVHSPVKIVEFNPESIFQEIAYRDGWSYVRIDGRTPLILESHLKKIVNK